MGNNMCGKAPADVDCRFSVVLPCRNERNTVTLCVAEALELGQDLQTEQCVGEVLVADNGSEDGSGELAQHAGARVVAEKRPVFHKLGAGFYPGWEESAFTRMWRTFTAV